MQPLRVSPASQPEFCRHRHFLSLAPRYRCRSHNNRCVAMPQNNKLSTWTGLARRKKIVIVVPHFFSSSLNWIRKFIKSQAISLSRQMADGWQVRLTKKRKRSKWADKIVCDAGNGIEEWKVRQMHAHESRWQRQRYFKKARNWLAGCHLELALIVN